MRHLNYEIYIKVDEHALEEYDVRVDEQDDRIINCWIASTVRKSERRVLMDGFAS